MALVALSLLSLNAFAGDEVFTTAEFSIIKKDHATRTVTVAATLGCLDELVFGQFEVINDTIHAVSVVRSDSDSMRVMCYRANTVVKQVKVQDIDHVTLINEEIH